MWQAETLTWVRLQRQVIAWYHWWGCKPFRKAATQISRWGNREPLRLLGRTDKTKWQLSLSLLRSPSLQPPIVNALEELDNWPKRQDSRPQKSDASWSIRDEIRLLGQGGERRRTKDWPLSGHSKTYTTRAIQARDMKERLAQDVGALNHNWSAPRESAFIQPNQLCHRPHPTRV